MAVRAIENDIETAIKLVIEDRLIVDDITGVDVDTLTNEAPGEEHRKPYIFVMCRPVTHMGGKTDQWSGQVAIEIQTKHLNNRDKNASNLVNLLASVGYALDYGDFSTKATRLNSIQLRRIGGDYTFEESMNSATIDVEIVKACGEK